MPSDSKSAISQAFLAARSLESYLDDEAQAANHRHALVRNVMEACKEAASAPCDADIERLRAFAQLGRILTATGTAHRSIGSPTMWVTGEVARDVWEAAVDALAHEAAQQQQKEAPDAERTPLRKPQVSMLAPPLAPRIPGWFNAFRMYSCGWGATAGCMVIVRGMQQASVSNPVDWVLGCIGLLSLAGLLSAAWHFAPGGEGQ